MMRYYTSSTRLLICSPTRIDSYKSFSTSTCSHKINHPDKDSNTSHMETTHSPYLPLLHIEENNYHQYGPIFTSEAEAKTQRRHT